MGLIKTNYVSKNTGITLPTAYAVLKDLSLEGENARATFVIQSSREATQSLTPIDKVTIPFKWDRKTDLAKMAYQKAKTQKFTYTDYKTKANFDVEGTLYGWNDDIV